MNQDPRQFWNAYRPFLHSRRGSKSNDIILKEGDEIVTDKSRIANIFNDYFVNIANNIEDPSSEVYGKHFGGSSEYDGDQWQYQFSFFFFTYELHLC